jgi:hypothetical protein
VPAYLRAHLPVRLNAVTHVYEMTSRLDEGKHFLGELREHWEVREVPASAAPQLPHMQQHPHQQQPEGSWHNGTAPPGLLSAASSISGAPGRGTATEGQVRGSQYSRAPASVVAPASGPSLFSQSGFQPHPHHHIECAAGAGGPGGSPTRARPGTVKLGATLLEHHLLWHWCLLDIGSGDSQHALTRYDNSMASRGVSWGALYEGTAPGAGVGLGLGWVGLGGSYCGHYKGWSCFRVQAWYWGLHRPLLNSLGCAHNLWDSHLVTNSPCALPATFCDPLW